ncbi:MAG: YeeE/YedE family protein, partial [Pseudomonadota bacterium]
MTETTATATGDLSVPWLTRRNIIVVLVGAATLLTGYLYLSAEFGWRQGALFVVGGALGVTLYHAAFGFTGSWRNLILSGKGGGVRAQMVMLGLAVCLFFPALSAGSLFDRSVGGFV